MSRSFVPAAGHDLLLPLYDPLWRLIGGQKLRADFMTASGLSAGQRVLDIGCGTGSLAIQIAESFEGVEVTALDPDPKALDRARRKAEQSVVQVDFVEGFADDLPFDAHRFDRVVSSFMFHHLDPGVKDGMLREARRVLAPGGELHLIDFGGRDSEEHGFLARLLHSHDNISDNLSSDRFRSCGFDEVGEVARSRSLFGSYTHLRAVSA